MKKLFCLLILSLCHFSYTEANTDISNFDIEGIKLGMTKEQVTPIIEKVCSEVIKRDPRSFFYEVSNSSNDFLILNFEQIYCSNNAGEDFKTIFGNNKLLTVFLEKNQSFSTNINDITKQELIKTIQEKLEEKYGKYDNVLFNNLNEINVFPQLFGERPHVAFCWKNCEFENNNLVQKGNGLMVQIYITEKHLSIGRRLTDVDAISEHNQLIQAENEEKERKAKEKSLEEARSAIKALSF